jgi:hypothetical protein
MMTDHPVELDEHRGMAAQRSTEIRRRLHEVQADEAALRRRLEEFERHAVAAPSTTWPEAAAKARYLIQLFAGTPEARDPRRRELIAQVLDDLARLSVFGSREPTRGDIEKLVVSRGTDGSNPVPSSGESTANLTFGLWKPDSSRVYRRV